MKRIPSVQIFFSFLSMVVWLPLFKLPLVREEQEIDLSGSKSGPIWATCIDPREVRLLLAGAFFSLDLQYQEAWDEEKEMDVICTKNIAC